MSELYLRNLDSYINDNEEISRENSDKNFATLLQNPDYLTYIVSQSVKQGNRDTLRI